MNMIKRALSFIVLGSLAFTNINVFGANDGGGLKNPVNINTFSDLINAIADWLLSIGLVLAPLMFIIGGVMFVTAYGNASKVQNAKNLMIYTAIGIGVILLAKSLVEVLKGFIG